MINSKQNKNDEEINRMMAELIRDITLERESQGLSQIALAEMAGVKQSAISRMENLTVLPQLDTLLRVLQPLGLKLNVSHKNIRRDFMNIKNCDIKKLEVETISCRLSVTTSTDDDFHIVTDNENDFTLENTGEDIIIRQKKRFGLKWLFQWVPVDIKITIPRNFSGDVNLTNHNGRISIYSINLGVMNVKNGNGTLEFEDINAGDMLLQNGNGRIEVQGANFKSVDAHSGNGRIQLVDVKTQEKINGKTSNGRVILKNCMAQKFDFTSSNGAILLSGCAAEKIKCSTSNGRIAASLLGNQDEFAMDFTTSMGSIWVGNQKFTGRYLVKSEGKKLEAHTSNGSIRFRFADTPDLDDGGVEDAVDILEEELEVFTNDRQNS